MVEGHFSGDRYVAGHYEPEEITAEELAQANQAIVCEEHHVQPSICGCTYDPISASELAQTWNENEQQTAASYNGSESSGPGMQAYLDLLAEVDRDVKLHQATLRREQHRWKEFHTE